MSRLRARRLANTAVVRAPSAMLLVAALAQGGCSHSVQVKTEPPGATLYVDGEKRGVAPVELQEQAGLFSKRDVRIEKPGYVTMETTLEQSRPNLPMLGVAGCLAMPTCGLSCLGLRYATQYPSHYEYRLSPEPAGEGPAPGRARSVEGGDTAATLPF